MADYKWKPIEDLPEDWTKLASSELGGLAAVWVEHYETIKDSKALKQFNERLRREWAIETGIIENLYYIDRGVTLTLIEKGIEASFIPHGSTDRPAELIVPILKDHEEVVTGLFDFVGQQRQLSTSYIKQLHQALTQHQRTTAAKDNFGTIMEVELLRGEWKKLPNNPTKSDDSIHEYCPPEQVASEMDRLILLHQEHLEKGVPPEVEAAWLHHRFTQIHPFQDGNGRMARTLASLIFLRAGLFPLIIHRDEREEYLDILLEADFGDLKPLIQFVSRSQKKAINQAVSLSENILLDNTPLKSIIEAGVNRLKNRQNNILAKLNPQEKNSGKSVLYLAKSKLGEVEEKLRKQLVEISPHFETASFSYTDYDEDLEIEAAPYNGLTALSQLYQDMDRIAKYSGYVASFSSFPLWLFLQIRTSNNFEIVFSFHQVGKTRDELFAVAAFIPSQTTLNENWDTNTIYEKRLSKDVFQFSYKEPQESVAERFNVWFDEVILNGINYWQQQL